MVEHLHLKHTEGNIIKRRAEIKAKRSKGEASKFPILELVNTEPFKWKSHLQKEFKSSHLKCQKAVLWRCL
jgi:hypothetical protein